VSREVVRKRFARRVSHQAPVADLTIRQESDHQDRKRRDRRHQDRGPRTRLRRNPRHRQRGHHRNDDRSRCRAHPDHESLLLGFAAVLVFAGRKADEHEAAVRSEQRIQSEKQLLAFDARRFDL
jgi:hypothetical protein